jgi:hypothetical protein
MAGADQGKSRISLHSPQAASEPPSFQFSTMPILEGLEFLQDPIPGLGQGVPTSNDSLHAIGLAAQLFEQSRRRDDGSNRRPDTSILTNNQ